MSREGGIASGKGEEKLAWNIMSTTDCVRSMSFCTSARWPYYSHRKAHQSVVLASRPSFDSKTIGGLPPATSPHSQP